LAAECSWCHLHKVGDPAPHPELCGVPDPDAPDRSRRTPDYQTAAGIPIVKDPYAGRRIDLGGGGRMRPQRGRLDIPGQEYRNRSCHRARGKRAFAMSKGVRVRMQASKTELEDRLKAIMKTPAHLRSFAKKKFPDRALELIKDYHEHRRFMDLVRDGMTKIEAGQEVFGKHSHQTYYNLFHKIEDAGGPTELFQASALRLWDDEDFPWGHQIQNGPWSRAFFGRLVGGRLDYLAHLCRTDALRFVTLRQLGQRGDMAAAQAILFSFHSTLFDGRAAAWAARVKAMDELEAEERELGLEDEL
jgi:hypothetical protein